MNLINLTIIWCAFIATVLAQQPALKNSSQEYHLKTKLKPGQSSKSRFNGLWVVAYHTGAGLDDAVTLKSDNFAAKGFLNGTNGEVAGVKYQNQVFDLGDGFPSIMIPEPNVNFYAAWEPVRINAGSGASDPKGTNGGFWLNSTGLQWTADLKSKPTASNNIFGGWLVCDWWHGVPQLFFRISYYDDPAPCSCADVWLCPEYI